MMEFSTFSTLFSILNVLRGYPAALIVLLTAVSVAHYGNWRFALGGLFIQYLAAGFLYADFLEPRHVFVKILVGQFVCLILYVTVYQLTRNSSPIRQVVKKTTRHLQPDRRVNFQFAAAKTILLLLAIPIALGAATQIQLPGFSSEHTHITWAIWGLALISLLGLSHQRKALPVGMNLLLFLAGFNLYYSYLIQTTVSFAILAVVNIIVATAVAFVAQVSSWR